MASGVGAVVVRPEVAVVEHAHGGITLGADVMNGHVNADIATVSSVQSPRRGQRPASILVAGHESAAVLIETDGGGSNAGSPRPRASSSCCCASR